VNKKGECPNEQFNYVLKGEIIHVPPNALHSMVATTEEDVVYYVAKDASFGIHGIPEDGEKTGAHYEPGYGTEKKG
jgi:hypothetical protein